MVVANFSPKAERKEMREKFTQFFMDDKPHFPVTVRMLTMMEFLLSDFEGKHSLGTTEVPAYDLEALRKEGVPLGLHGEGLGEELILKISEVMSRNSVFFPPSHYFGHMLTTPMIPALLGYWMGMAYNQNNVTPEVASVTSVLEKDYVSMLCQLVGYKEGVGYISAGGTTANTWAMFVAKNRVMADAQREKGVVFVPKTYHYSFDRIADMLGLELVGVEVDKHFRMDVNDLRAKVEAEKRPKVAIVGVFGTTETGTLDPVDEIAKVAQEHGVYFHLDAAYGGFAYFAPSLKAKFNLSLPDSITIDPHKCGYIPYAAGALLFKDAETAKKRAYTPPYLRISEHGGTSTLEGSRPGAAALSAWLTLKVVGATAMGEIAEVTMENARFFHHRLQQVADWVPLNEPDLNVVAYRYGDGIEEMPVVNAWNKAVYEHVNKSGFVVSLTDNLSGTGMVALRSVFMNPLTTRGDIRDFVKVLAETTPSTSIT